MTNLEKWKKRIAETEDGSDFVGILGQMDDEIYENQCYQPRNIAQKSTGCEFGNCAECKAKWFDMEIEEIKEVIDSDKCCHPSKQLDNGMKPSEYLSTHKGKVGLKAYVSGMFDIVYQYPQFYIGVCLYSDGCFQYQIKPKANDWEMTDDMVAILCEYNYSYITNTISFLKSFDCDKYIDEIIEKLKAEGN